MKEIVLAGYSSRLLSAWWRKSDGYGESTVSLWFSISLFVCSLDLFNTVLSLERHWQGLRHREVLRCNVTTRMISVLGWAAMRATFMFDSSWGAGSQDCVHKPQLLKWGEPIRESNCCLLLTGLTPYHHVKSGRPDIMYWLIGRKNTKLLMPNRLAVCWLV